MCVLKHCYSRVCTSTQALQLLCTVSSVPTSTTALLRCVTHSSYARRYSGSSTYYYTQALRPTDSYTRTTRTYAAAQRRSKEVRQQTRRMERAGHISAALGARRRLAAEVAVSDAYHPGYKAPCEMRGDRFFPVILTNHGGWYYHSSDFMMEVTHSGDKADSFNIEAERFDHYSRTWASWQHSAFLMQAVSCTMAQAAYVAMVSQSKKDLAIESGGRSSFESYGRSAGVQPPSPRVNRP